jgi:putative photosynthetic complex assembly protein 2
MSQIALPALYALLLWWFSTGIILYAVGLSPRSYPVSVGIATVGLVVGLWALARGGQDSAVDAYISFSCVLAVWGFVETTFLTGYVTGNRKTQCPPSSNSWQRVRYAIEAILYHELLLIAAGVAIAVATGGRNHFALALFAILWVMRLSSKLNLFLGVPMLNAELLPPHLAHLRSYFTRKRMNPLLPVSISGSAIVTALLIDRAFTEGAGDYSVVAYVLLASLLALALLEHLFMLMPIPIAGLWGPRIKARAERVAASETAAMASRPQTSEAELASARARIQRINSVGGLL